MLDSQALLKELESHANPKNQVDMEAYQRHQFSFLGIKSPDRRLIVKPYLQAAKKEGQRRAKLGLKDIIDWPAILELWNYPSREAQYVAADYLKMMDKYLTYEDLDKLEDLICHKSWWDSVDALVKRVGSLTLKDSRVKKRILAWAQSDNIWLVRTAIIHQLALKEQTDLVLLSQVIDQNMASQEFFIDKAIGWALREHAKTDPIWVVDFVNQRKDDLSKLSQREALKNLKA